MLKSGQAHRQRDRTCMCMRKLGGMLMLHRALYRIFSTLLMLASVQWEVYRAAHLKTEYIDDALTICDILRRYKMRRCRVQCTLRMHILQIKHQAMPCAQALGLSADSVVWMTCLFNVLDYFLAWSADAVRLLLGFFFSPATCQLATVFNGVECHMHAMYPMKRVSKIEISVKNHPLSAPKNLLLL